MKTIDMPITINRAVSVKSDVAPELKTRKAISVCFFNNKGGVGKTTLVANLAAQLALKDRMKLLLVDADPQCNLTQYLIEDTTFHNIYTEENPVNTIYDIVLPLSIGKGYSEKLPIRRAENFGVDLIAGDPRLALREDLLAQDWRDAKAGGTRGLRTTFIFAELIKRASANYDYIFFDMGPSLGAINRSVLLSVDCFIVPMSIDIFSIWAIKNIGQAVTKWRSELDNGIRLSEDPSEITAFSDKRRLLSFLGYVMQQHKEKREGDKNRVVQAYDTIKMQIPDAVKEHLQCMYPKSDFNPHLCDIKHLGSLAPRSQTDHTPMISVMARGSYTTTRKTARKIYELLALRFKENLSKIPLGER